MRIFADEPTRDVAGADASIAEHLNRRAEIEMRQSDFEAIEKFGLDLVARGHYAAKEVERKTRSLVRAPLFPHIRSLQSVPFIYADILSSRSKPNWDCFPLSATSCGTTGLGAKSNSVSVRLRERGEDGIALFNYFFYLVLEVHVFARDAHMADRWLNSVEQYFLMEDVGVRRTRSKSKR